MSVTAKNSKKNFFKRLAKALLVAITMSTGFLSLTGFFGTYAYILNLTSHFRVQYALVSLICAIPLWLLGKRKTSAIALSLLILNLAEIVPLYQKPVLNASPGLGSFSIMQLNVLSDNHQFELVREEVRRLDPDVVVMEEVTPAWYEALEPIRKKYPYVLETLHKSELGIMIMSKIPLSQTELIDFNDARLPSLVTALEFEGQTITLIATHPLSPRNRTKSRLRNDQLYAIARAFKEHENPLIMVGDLNITSFSPVFKKFMEQIDLYDSRKGFGVQPSWPAQAWAILRVTIDHCLLSPDFQVSHREIGRYVGSDHLPVFVKVNI